MSTARDRVRNTVEGARSTDDLVDDFDVWPPPPDDSPLDEETLDEMASTQMGPWDLRRQDAN